MKSMPKISDVRLSELGSEKWNPALSSGYT